MFVQQLCNICTCCAARQHTQIPRYVQEGPKEVPLKRGDIITLTTDPAMRDRGTPKVSTHVHIHVRTISRAHTRAGAIYHLSKDRGASTSWTANLCG
jgi:hypothetical protein